MKMYEIEVTLDKDGIVWGTCPVEVNADDIRYHNTHVDEWNEEEIEASGLHGTEYIHRGMEYYLVDEPEENGVQVMSEDIHPYTDSSWLVLITAYSSNRAYRNAYSFACAHI